MINKTRMEFVKKHAGERAVFDIGVGSGEFIKKRKPLQTMGFDINPAAVDWLKENNLYTEDYDKFAVFTFWDVIEHCRDPELYFKRIPQDALLFTAIPIFKNLKKIRYSRHYRPDEHYYYFTRQGFVNYMLLWGFSLIDENDGEIKAGREDIYSFAFRKTGPGYGDMVGQYAQIHASQYYGSSAHLYFDRIAKEILEINPKSILDFGCGRSNFACYFWGDGRRRIDKYDPAIPEFKDFPDGKYGLVLCMDVMEHIEMRDLDRIFESLKSKSKKCLFTISLISSRAKLPDGRNAHVTLLRREEWIRWINSYYHRVKELKSGYKHILIALGY